MKIQKMKVADLKPLEQNVRKHGEVQLKELVRSLGQFGQTRALVIDEDKNILIGNGLHAAMVRAGITEAAVYVKRGLTEVEKKKLILADNKTYALGADHYENIEAYLADITATGDFDVAGFDEDVLRNLMRDAEEVLQDVQTYGVLEPAAVEQKHELQAKRDEQAERAADSPGNGLNSASHPVDDSLPAEAHRTVICPACGEVIPLD
ncbi:MAG: ParB N-terminal domain-containing protein [Candidatus Spyradenecus sp.]